MDASSVNGLALTASGVSACYTKSQPVLVDLSLELHRGECLAVMGTSGSGKSTLLKCVAGLLPISSGSLQLGDRVYADADGLSMIGHELRRRVTYVPQEITLFGHYTVRKNLALVMGKQHSKRETTGRLTGLFRQLHISGDPDEVLMRYPDQLSGGQRQRVQLLRALLNSPDVLLLDEVTSQIDAAAASAVIATIRSIREFRPELAIILVTHNGEFAREFADRCVHMRDGQLHSGEGVARGT